MFIILFEFIILFNFKFINFFLIIFVYYLINFNNITKKFINYKIEGNIIKNYYSDITLLNDFIFKFNKIFNLSNFKLFLKTGSKRYYHTVKVKITSKVYYLNNHKFISKKQEYILTQNELMHKINYGTNNIKNFINNSLKHYKIVNYREIAKDKVLVIMTNLTSKNKYIKFPFSENKNEIIKVGEKSETEFQGICIKQTVMLMSKKDFQNMFIELTKKDFENLGMTEEEFQELIYKINEILKEYGIYYYDLDNLTDIEIEQKYLEGIYDKPYEKFPTKFDDKYNGGGGMLGY